ncbi:MAG: hypothetical protein JNL32_02730 [Candidatus Kapabacteria bacterium]|nr:hypothetical protein [Candidatus Kapabacteria bacterium]
MINSFFISSATTFLSSEFSTELNSQSIISPISDPTFEYRSVFNGGDFQVDGVYTLPDKLKELQPNSPNAFVWVKNGLFGYSVGKNAKERVFEAHKILSASRSQFPIQAKLGSDSNEQILTSTVLNSQGYLETLIFDKHGSLYLGAFFESSGNNWVLHQATNTDDILLGKDVPHEVISMIISTLWLANQIVFGRIEYRERSNEYYNYSSDIKHHSSYEFISTTSSSPYKSIPKSPTLQHHDRDRPMCISHNLRCSLPGKGQDLITRDGRMYLWSTCSGSIEINVLECCKQHDVDLWCSESRSLISDPFQDINFKKIFDFLLALGAGSVGGSLASPFLVRYLRSLLGRYIGTDGLLSAEFAHKTARAADFKVVDCVYRSVIDQAYGKVKSYCPWDYVIVSEQILLGSNIADIITLGAWALHDKSLLGLDGRNRESCLCGGSRPTTRCNPDNPDNLRDRVDGVLPEPCRDLCAEFGKKADCYNCKWRCEYNPWTERTSVVPDTHPTLPCCPGTDVRHAPDCGLESAGEAVRRCPQKFCDRCFYRCEYTKVDGKPGMTLGWVYHGTQKLTKSGCCKPHPTLPKQIPCDKEGKTVS